MSPSSLLGAAGEHYVMPQLLRRGFIAALAPVGVPIADIVITNDAGERACALQVKTRREIGSDAGWHRKARHEGIRSASLFRSEEQTSELQSLMRISYAVVCLKKNNTITSKERYTIT